MVFQTKDHETNEKGRLMGKTKDRLEKFEKKHGVEIFMHIILRYGKNNIKVYRIVDNEDQRGKPISQEALMDLNIFLVKEYGSLMEKIRILFSKKRCERSPLQEFSSTITMEEIERLQELESKGYELANSCYD